MNVMTYIYVFGPIMLLSCLGTYEHKGLLSYSSMLFFKISNLRFETKGYSGLLQ